MYGDTVVAMMCLHKIQAYKDMYCYSLIRSVHTYLEHICVNVRNEAALKTHNEQNQFQKRGVSFYYRDFW